MSKTYRLRMHGKSREIDVDSLKNNILLSDVVTRRTKLMRAGRQLVGLCPFHEERTPSFFVNDALGLYHCHGCRRGGDMIRFVQETTDCRFMHALEWLVGFADGRCTDVVDIQRAHEAQRRHRLFLREEARCLWKGARTIVDTPAEAYLASRGITGRIPGTLRFTRAPLWIDPETERRGRWMPALVAAAQDVDGEIIGLQITFLDGRGRKAALNRPRRNLGQIRGGALRLGPEASELILCEGLEDGLSLMRMFTGASVWVGLGGGNIANMALPPLVRSVILAGDNDDAGHAAIKRAGMAFAERGIATKDIFPRAAKDFNDEWRLLHA